MRIKPVAATALLEKLLQSPDGVEHADGIEPVNQRGCADGLGAADPRRCADELACADDDDADIRCGAPAFAHTAELSGIELPRGGIDLKDHLSAIEIGLIRKALEEADGTVAEAARLLRMRRTTLVEKLRKYRLSA